MGIGKCKKCKFWNPDTGECSFRDPVFGKWPVTKKDDWCGDWIKSEGRKVKWEA